MPGVEAFENMKKLLSGLGHPESSLNVVHIAGTNGKGSTAVMIASILEAAGYCVGLYTSPHLELECERIQIWDGTHRMIPQEHFEELMEKARAAAREEGIGSLPLFGYYTAAAYMYFDEVQPDYVVSECGLGGRLDMTNTIDKPLVSVITQIGLDHTGELGNTIFKVAREKAGIIKPGVPVVSQTGDLNVKNIIRRTAGERGCLFADASLLEDTFAGYELGMAGEYQIRNAATAAEAVKAAGIEISEDDVRTGLRKAVLPGRFEILREKPYWIIDGAHNPPAIEALTETFNRFCLSNRIRRTLLIFGCMKDKNSRMMINHLTSSLRGVNFASAAVEYDRAEDPVVIGEMFASNGRGCICYDSVREAFEDAASSNFECVLVTGSIYIAGEFRELYSNLSG